jgi:hypothetical protein
MAQDQTRYQNKKTVWNDADIIAIQSVKTDGKIVWEKTNIGEFKTALGIGAEGYLRYEVALTQAGGVKPSAVELTNELGVILSYVYDAPGSYFIDASAPIFAVSKVYGVQGMEQSGGNPSITLDYVSPTRVQIRSTATGGSGFQGNDLLNNSFLEIRVYP